MAASAAGAVTAAGSAAGAPDLLPTVIGTTLTAAGVAMAVTTPLWGRLGDAIGRWRVLPVCLLAVAAALVGEALAPALPQFQAAIVAAGLFQGGIGATVIALLALLTPEDRRATILNFSLLPSQLSWFLGPVTGAGLAAISLRLPFAVGAAAAAGALALALAQAVRARPAEGAAEGTAARAVGRG